MRPSVILLLNLAEKSGIKIPESLLVKLREFMEFHFEARYPDANKVFYRNPKNAVAFFGKRNLWPNTASKLAVQILTYLKQYAPFCPTSFSLSLAQILRLPRKIKTKCIVRDKCTRGYTAAKLKEIKEVYKWLKAKL